MCELWWSYSIGEECIIVIPEQKNNDRADNNIPTRLLLLGNEVEWHYLILSHLSGVKLHSLLVGSLLQQLLYNVTDQDQHSDIFITANHFYKTKTFYLSSYCLIVRSSISGQWLEIDFSQTTDCLKRKKNV